MAVIVISWQKRFGFRDAERPTGSGGTGNEDIAVHDAFTAEPFTANRNTSRRESIETLNKSRVIGRLCFNCNWSYYKGFVDMAYYTLSYWSHYKGVVDITHVYDTLLIRPIAIETKPMK